MQICKVFSHSHHTYAEIIFPCFGSGSRQRIPHSLYSAQLVNVTHRMSIRFDTRTSYPLRNFEGHLWKAAKLSWIYPSGAIFNIWIQPIQYTLQTSLNSDTQLLFLIKWFILGLRDIEKSYCTWCNWSEFTSAGGSQSDCRSSAGSQTVQYQYYDQYYDRYD